MIPPSGFMFPSIVKQAFTTGALKFYRKGKEINKRTNKNKILKGPHIASWRRCHLVKEGDGKPPICLWALFGISVPEILFLHFYS